MRCKKCGSEEYNCLGYHSSDKTVEFYCDCGCKTVYKFATSEEARAFFDNCGSFYGLDQAANLRKMVAENAK
jgi:hypothetical protein